MKVLDERPMTHDVDIPAPTQVSPATVGFIGRLGPPGSCLMRGLEEPDRIAVRIEDLDLPACRSGFHGVPKCHSSLAQRFDDRGQIAHSKNDAVKAAGALLPAVR